MGTSPACVWIGSSRIVCEGPRNWDDLRDWGASIDALSRN